MTPMSVYLLLPRAFNSNALICASNSAIVILANNNSAIRLSVVVDLVVVVLAVFEQVALVELVVPFTTSLHDTRKEIFLQKIDTKKQQHNKKQCQY
mgnify:CR=1 FL=1